MASSEITAAFISSPVRLNAGAPDPAWQRAEPIRFSADWQGRNADPQLETEVRVLWSPETLYVRFLCRYQQLSVFDDSEPDGRRDHLWDRDVVEAFLQPPDCLRMGEGTGASKFYKEFEVAPNGMWIDLDLSPTGLADLKSGLTRSVCVDDAREIWSAELAIPVESLTSHFDPGLPWRANFYRVEGRSEPRRYMAWQPTNTRAPNFHVPERFGTLLFHIGTGEPS